MERATSKFNNFKILTLATGYPLVRKQSDRVQLLIPAKFFLGGKETERREEANKKTPHKVYTGPKGVLTHSFQNLIPA